MFWFYLDCERDFFGDKCANMCHCKDDKPCKSVTGECSAPGCVAEWKGLSCSTRKYNYMIICSN